ncbi:cobalamin-binding protein [bacterium]|nr:MAG: cobalamin-binding protein [bacterium]
MIRKLKAKSLKFRILFFVFLFSLFCFHSSLFTYSYAETPNRIVSLAPGITEILFAAGLGDRVVGVTTFCDSPEEAKSKPKVGGMSNPSLEAVFSLQPDIVVMTTDGNPKEFEQKLRALKIKTHVFESLTLDELSGGIREMGIALDEKDKFDALSSNIEQALHSFKTRRIAERKKVLFIIWPEPLIVAGPRTAVNDAINLLGHINIAGQTKSRYPKYSVEEILRQSPDFIFIGIGKGMEEISDKLLKKLSHVPAVKTGKVFYVSDSLYRLGPRVVAGLEELEKYLEGSEPAHRQAGIPESKKKNEK